MKINRRRQDGHIQPIPSTESSVSLAVQEVVDLVFGHQRACFDYRLNGESQSSLLDRIRNFLQLGAGDRRNDDGYRSKTMKRHQVAKRFFNHDFMSPMELHLSGPDGRVVSICEFLDSIGVASTAINEPCKTSYLTGQIGAGKSTFLNAIITKHGRSIFTERMHYFIRVNLEGADIDSLGANEFVSVVSEKVINVLRKPEMITYLHSNELSHRTYSRVARKLRAMRANGRRKNPSPDNFVQAINEISRLLGKRLFLVIDNVDRYYRQFDRVELMCSDGTAITQQAHSLVSLQQMLRTDEALSQLSASILFVVRDVTFDLVQQSNDLAFPDHVFRNSKNRFHLDRPNWRDDTA